MADEASKNDARSANAKVLAVAGTCLLSLALLTFAACSQQGGPVSADDQPTAGETSTGQKEDADKNSSGKDNEGAKADKTEATDGKQDDEQEEKPSYDQAAADSLAADIAAAADASGMDTCVSVIDLTNGMAVSHHGDTQMASASMIKMLIAYSFLEQVQAGNQSLDATYTLKGSDLVGGTGVIAGYGAGAQLTYRDILMRMIDASDNTATNILIDAIGFDAINATAKELGLSQTVLNRKMMDYDAIAAGRENYTCADDLALLMHKAYDGTFVDKASSELVMQALRQQEDWGGVKNGLPEGVSFAHKTGALDSVRHDGGIVEGSHPFVLVVLCGGQGFYEQGALQAMAEVARVTYAGVVG